MLRLKVKQNVVVSDTEKVEDKVSDKSDPKPESSSLTPNTLQTKHIPGANFEPAYPEPETLASQDEPYSITKPLPPIFSSQLFHHSKAIRFMSISLPSLDSICWGEINDTLEDLADQAEEALNEQYDENM